LVGLIEGKFYQIFIMSLSVNHPIENEAMPMELIPGKDKMIIHRVDGAGENATYGKSYIASDKTMQNRTMNCEAIWKIWNSLVLIELVNCYIYWFRKRVSFVN